MVEPVWRPVVEVQDLHQQGVCFATEVAAWSLLRAQYISGGGLSVSERDLSACSFAQLDNLEIIASVKPVWRPVATGPRTPPQGVCFATEMAARSLLGAQ